MLEVLCSGSVIGHFSKVALQQTQLILGSIRNAGNLSGQVTSHPVQLSLAIHP